MKVRVRMYRQGLGDCFLVTFHTGPKPVHMLIDCGTLGATTTGVKMKDVAADISKETNDHLHLLIATHEHKDHLSGFRSEQAAFDAMKVDRVWLAWTEDPDDQLAKDIAKCKKDILNSMRLAAAKLEGNRASAIEDRTALAATGSGIRELLGFYGDVDGDGASLGATFAETVNEAMNYVASRAPKKPQYLSPGKLIEPDWLPGVRFYVLGPPRSEARLNAMGEHGSPELYELAGSLAADFAANARFFASELPLAQYCEGLSLDQREEFERSLPFDLRFRREASDQEARKRFLAAYDDPAAGWRRIDYDWLAPAAELALQLDSKTNNTSLVLAMELIADSRVLLFPADAQVGNWLSWHEPAMQWKVPDAEGQERVVTAADLLRRTVFYKVGHHASHNATVKEKGLEIMAREDLVAMIPVDRSVALNKTPPWKMPAAALYKRLLEKTSGRVLRSDTGWPDHKQRPASVSKTAWDQARNDTRITVSDLFIDLQLD